jgi:hypothetical protein
MAETPPSARKSTPLNRILHGINIQNSQVDKDVDLADLSRPDGDLKWPAKNLENSNFINDDEAGYEDKNSKFHGE